MGATPRSPGRMRSLDCRGILPAIPVELVTVADISNIAPAVVEAAARTAAGRGGAASAGATPPKRRRPSRSPSRSRNPSRKRRSPPPEPDPKWPPRRRRRAIPRFRRQRPQPRASRNRNSTSTMCWRCSTSRRRGRKRRRRPRASRNAALAASARRTPDPRHPRRAAGADPRMLERAGRRARPGATDCPGSRFLARDGSLAAAAATHAAEPRCRSIEPYIDAAAQAALRAVNVCAPYKRPADGSL